MSQLIYQWIDLLWLPIGWLITHKPHRVKIVIFIATCLVTMRTQIEMMLSTGYRTGFLPLMDSSIHTRALIIYSVIIAIFLLMTHYSPRTDNIVFLAAAISIYIFAFCVSMIIMLL